MSSLAMDKSTLDNFTMICHPPDIQEVLEGKHTSALVS